MPALPASLRDGSFLTRPRAWLWSLAFLAGFAAAIAWLFATAHGLNDYAGRPLGSDFSSFYAAGRLALAGGDAYDQTTLHHMQQGLFGAATPFYAFSYPPIFLLLAAPLAALPYIAALTAWQLGTLALYLAALRQLLRSSDMPLLAHDPLWLAAALSFTAVFVNLGHGQNGFLTAALFALGLARSRTDSWRAGLWFGLLAFKPQLGLVIPFALLAGGRWRSLTAAALAIIALAGLSVALFGAASWHGFLMATDFSRHAILESGAIGYEKMVSVFAWMRLWHLPLPLAYGAQAVASLAVILAVARLWRGPAAPAWKGAGLCVGTLLATPFALDYDLMLLAPGLALLAARLHTRGGRPYETGLLVLLWFMPIVARGAAGAAAVPVAAWSLILALIFVLRAAASRA